MENEGTKLSEEELLLLDKVDGQMAQELPFTASYLLCFHGDQRISVAYEDCDRHITKPALTENKQLTETLLEAERMPIYLSLCNCGDTVENQKVFRCQIYVWNPQEQEYYPEEYWLTKIPVTTNNDTALRAVNILADWMYEKYMHPAGRNLLEAAKHLEMASVESLSVYAQNASKMRVRRRAYEKYQFFWLMDHGYTIRDICNIVQEWKDDNDSNPDEFILFDEYLEENGFHGAFYPCFEEFLENEYLNEGLMRTLLDPEDIWTYHQDAFPDIEIIIAGDEAAEAKYPKFWSNACGELHRYGKEDITEDKLPEALRWAYHHLWAETYNGLCYLVELPEGYGIALNWEYSENNEDVAGNELFQILLNDARDIRLNPLFRNARIIAGKNTGFMECHELFMVFPAKTPQEEFEAAMKFIWEYK